MENDLDNLLQKRKYIKLWRPNIMANQAYLSNRSLNTSLCDIYDHKAAFLLVKTVIHKSLITIYGKDVPV